MPQQTTQRIESILEELYELEANQHSHYYKHEPKGRARMAFLLLKLNAVEEERSEALQREEN